MSKRQRTGVPLGAEDSGSADYEVGYGRPPRASRFKPGQCGNPKGRPRKPKTLMEAVERELDRTAVVREGGREKRLTKREVVSRQLVDASCRGQLGATRLLRDFGGGVMIERGPPSDPVLTPAHPIDATDRQIIASFAAMIQAGAQIDPAAAPNASAADDDADALGEAGPPQQGFAASLPPPACH